MLNYVRRGGEPTWFACPPDLPEPLHALLVERGIRSEAEARAFLNPGVHSLHDPLLLSDMAAAAARVRAALSAGEVICVYGDYDVDGVSASAILWSWLKAQGADARVYLPSRHTEGYGLNEAAVRAIAQWANLMVTVDCGVTSVELVALAKSLGLDVIVTDHHRPGEALPDCLVVNPLLSGYPFPALCGAGVAWKLVQAMAGLDAAMEYVDIAALATVADVVSLTGENRALVRLGLQRINAAPRPGLSALIDAAGLAERRITSTHIAFQLAPRLNAGGRLGSAMRSFELVTAQDIDRARALAQELNDENTRRKDVEMKILDEAEAQLARITLADHRAIVLAGEWNPGVIGLAASRLVERYHYPVILLADQGDRLTGSCRSIEGVDIHAALCGCAEYMVRFGGHKQAAGLTLAPGMLEPFWKALDEWLDGHVDPAVYIPVKEYDMALDFDAVTAGFIAALDDLQPTGFGNPSPVFRAMAELVDARAVGADGAHLKLTAAQNGHRLGGIAFGEGYRAESLPRRADLLFVPTLNSFRGRVTPEIEVKSLADGDAAEQLSSKLAAEPRLVCHFLTEILYNKKIPPKTREVRPTDAQTVRQWMLDSPQGTLILAADLAGAAALSQALSPARFDVMTGALPDDSRAFNALCVCPDLGQMPRGYRRIVLAGAPDEALWPMAGASEDGTGAVEAFALPDAPGWLRELPDLDALRGVYKAMVSLCGRVFAAAPEDLANPAAKLCGISPVTAMAAVIVLLELGLFEIAPGALHRTDLRRCEPEDSAAWRAMGRWRAKGIHPRSMD